MNEAEAHAMSLGASVPHPETNRTHAMYSRPKSELPAIVVIFDTPPLDFRKEHCSRPKIEECSIDEAAFAMDD
jgi:hypothetical protein